MIVEDSQVMAGTRIVVVAVEVVVAVAVVAVAVDKLTDTEEEYHTVQLLGRVAVVSAEISEQKVETESHMMR